MRVYDIYRFPTGSKRKPAELFKCIRTHLAQQQLTYDELLLLVLPSLWGRPADKYVYQYLPALKDVPMLAVGQHAIFTNADAQLRPLVSIEEDAVAALLAKIPRTFNPNNATVVFNGIPFGGHAAPILPGQYTVLGCQLPSSHIQIHYEDVFPSMRWVELRIDVTAEEGIRDSLPAATALAEALQLKWTMHRRTVELPDAEKQKYEALTVSAQPVADQISAKTADFQLPYQSCQSTEGYSIARPLKKALKPLGFISTGYAHNTLFFRRINDCGHGVCLSVDVSPISRILRPTITLRGLGFSFGWDIKASIPLNQQDADAFCQQFADFLSSILANDLETLSHCYPPTPDWFFTSSDIDC